MATGYVKKCVPKGYFETLAENTDFNNINTDGFFSVKTSANAPSGYTWYAVIVLCLSGSSQFLSQIVYCGGNQYLYTRNCVGGTWSSWARISTV